MGMAAARPRLASAIFDVLNSRWESGSQPKKRRLGTGCTSLDDALKGGFIYGDGSVSCVSGDTGKNTVS